MVTFQLVPLVILIKHLEPTKKHKDYHSYSLKIKHYRHTGICSCILAPFLFNFMEMSESTLVTSLSAQESLVIKLTTSFKL